ncbi:MAG: ADP-ribosylglycohydrolase family protein [Desulfobulbaceae bacterium]|nr:MAG: ADP-ribosylglycohydrolase family protein [Desulfobulbaceae bacterium]
MNSKALVIASLAADSLALGAHWIYDTARIKREFGQIKTLQQPPNDSYHPNRNKGEFTHYGDQTLVLLQSICRHNGFSLEQFSEDWQASMSAYDGYIDKATKETLANLSAGKPVDGCGSSSTDLGGAARIAPLVYAYHKQPGKLFDYVTQQTSFTHNHPATITGALTLAKITLRVLDGNSPAKAIDLTIAEGIDDMDLDLKMRAALESIDRESAEVIKEFGLACPISSALPGAVHLIAKYQDDYQTAMTENVMAGGDSAARGLAVGMVLGAYHDLKKIPVEWLSDMKAYDTIMDLLECDQD